MSIRKKNIYLLSFILIGLILFIFTYSIKGYEKTMTLNQALDMSFKEALKWQSDAELALITSIDNPDLTEKTNGSDGKRSWWNCIYFSPELKKELIVTIHDKKIVNVTPTTSPSPQKEFIRKNELIMSSSESVKEAISKYKLKPGINWANGYHYTLSKINSKLQLTVIGLDTDNYFTKIVFDGQDKVLLNAEHKVESGGGFFEGTSNLLSKTGKKLSVVGAAISPDYKNDKLMIIWYFLNPYQTNTSVGYSKSTDLGNNWERMNVPNFLSNIVFSKTYTEDKKLYGISDNKVFVSKNWGDTWDELFTDNDSNIISFDNFKNNVAILTQNTLYFSQDYGLNWKNVKIPNDATKVKVDLNNIFINTKDKVLKYNFKKLITIDFPSMVTNLGIDLFNDKFIVYDQQNIAIFNMITNKWDIIKSPIEINSLSIYNYSSLSLLCIQDYNNSIYKLKEGDKYEWIKINNSYPKEGRIEKVIITPEEKIYQCISSNPFWKEIPRR